ncbi:unnamed protein product, partial [marine sediment metagenome]
SDYQPRSMEGFDSLLRPEEIPLPSHAATATPFDEKTRKEMVDHPLTTPIREDVDDY